MHSSPKFPCSYWSSLSTSTQNGTSTPPQCHLSGPSLGLSLEWLITTFELVRRANNRYLEKDICSPMFCFLGNYKRFSHGPSQNGFKVVAGREIRMINMIFWRPNPHVQFYSNTFHSGLPGAFMIYMYTIDPSSLKQIPIDKFQNPKVPDHSTTSPLKKNGKTFTYKRHVSPSLSPCKDPMGFQDHFLVTCQVCQACLR